MHEQRLTVRLRKYWDMLRKAQDWPEIQKLNPAVIEDIWQQCFMVSIDAGAATTYKYEHVGNVITDIYGRDLTGLRVGDKNNELPGAVMISKLPGVIKERAPIDDDGFFINSSSRQVKYRACFLPFGNDKGITHIVAGISFRVF
jgi:hypothetical protein